MLNENTYINTHIRWENEGLTKRQRHQKWLEILLTEEHDMKKQARLTRDNDGSLPYYRDLYDKIYLTICERKHWDKWQYAVFRSYNFPCGQQEVRFSSLDEAFSWLRGSMYGGYDIIKDDRPSFVYHDTNAELFENKTHIFRLIYAQPSIVYYKKSEQLGGWGSFKEAVDEGNKILAELLKEKAPELFTEEELEQC